MNLFDLQRSKGQPVGYPRLGSKVVLAVFAVLFLLMFVGYSSGMSGRVNVENGFNLIPAATVNSMDSLLHQVKIKIKNKTRARAPLSVNQ